MYSIKVHSARGNTNAKPSVCSWLFVRGMTSISLYNNAKYSTILGCELIFKMAIYRRRVVGNPMLLRAYLISLMAIHAWLGMWKALYTFP